MKPLTKDGLSESRAMRLRKTSVHPNLKAESTKRIPRRTIVAAILMLLCCIVSSKAQSDKQPQRGFAQAGSFSLSDIEKINTSNGNLMFNIPIASLPINQGGSSGLTVSLQYNSKVFDPTAVLVPNGSTFSARTFLIPSPEGNWRYAVGYGLEVIDRRSDYYYPYGGAPAAECPSSMFASDIVKVRMRLPDGSTRDFRPTGIANDDLSHRSFFNTDPEGRFYYCRCLAPNGCGNPNEWIIENTAPTYATRTYYSSDGSYQKLVIAYGPPDGSGLRPRFWTLSMADGTQVSTDPTIALNGGQRILDRNNNYTDILSTTKNGNPATKIVDQLGRAIVIEKGPSGQDFIYANGTGGQELQWTIQWTTTFVNKTYYAGDTSFTQNINTGFVVIQSITLPAQVGGLSYTFEYNGASTHDYPNGGTVNPSVGWGEVSKITLPSGAYVTYTYKRDNQTTADSWEVLQNFPQRKDLHYLREYDNTSVETTETWTYTFDFYYAHGSAYLSTIVVPDGSKSSEFFNIVEGYAYGRPLLSIRPDGTTIERIWLPNRVSAQNGLNHDMNAYIKTEFVTIPGGWTAIKDYSYDKNGNITKIKEYDWVAQSTIHGGPGGTLAIPGTAQLKRVTVNSYYSSTPDATDATTNDPDSYYNSSSPRLRNAAFWTEIQNDTEQPLAYAEFTYDDALNKGNLTEQRSWDSTKGPRPTGQAPLLNGTNSILVTTQYTAYGMPRLITDARGTQTQISYGQVGPASNLYPTQIERAWGTPIERTETRQYDFNTGVVTAVVDLDNNVSTVISYDIFGRPILVRYAADLTDESQISAQYFDSQRRVVVRSDLDSIGDGKLASIQHYDQLGRVRLTRQLEEFSPAALADETAGIKVQTRYTISNPCQPLNDPTCLANNNSTLGSYVLTSNPYRASTSGAAGSESTMGWTRTRADRNSRIVEVQTFVGSGLPAPLGGNSSSSGVLTKAYESMFTTVTDQTGRVRRSKVDGLGRLVRLDEPSDSNHTLGSLDSPTQPTHYQYDAIGNLTVVTQGIQTRTFSYTSLSRLKEATNPESGTITYGYDDNGNLKTKIDPRLLPNTTTHIIIAYDYDELNRLKARTFNDGTPNVSYAYDSPTVLYSRGRLTSVSSIVSDYSCAEYDALGRVKTGTQTTDGQSYAMSYAYNRVGLLRSQTYPSGRVVTSEYDAAGRLAGVTNQASGFYYAGAAGTDTANRIQYAAHGGIGQMRLGNGLWEHTNFNSRLQPIQIGLGTASTNSSILQLDYSYGISNNNGNVQSQAISLPGGKTLTQSYAYDELNRLLSAQEMNGSDPSWQQSFTYTDVNGLNGRYGNRRINLTGTTAALIVENPQFDPATNRIQPQAGEQYTYDIAGNLIRNKTGHTFDYDAENRQTKYDGGDPITGGASYSYDGDGRRVKTVTSSGTTVFVYNVMGQLVAEYSDAQAASSGTSYLTADHLGTPRVITGPNGAVIGRHDYLPFGEEIAESYGERSTVLGYIANDNLRQKFTSYERDDESDVDFAQARYFSKALGRFNSPDPYVFHFLMRDEKNAKQRFASIQAYISEPRNWNRYTYCVNDPVNLIDPSGLIWLTIDHQNYVWVDDDKYRREDWKGYTEVEPGTIAYFGGGHGGYEAKYKHLIGSYVILNADGSLSPAGVKETDAPDDAGEAARAGWETARQWTQYRTTIPDFLPAYVQLEVDFPGPPIAAGPAVALTLDRNGNLYTGPGAYAGTPGANLSLGWLLPNEPADNIESFLLGHSVGGSVLSPCWVGGGVTRASGRYSPQIMVGSPGASGSYIYSEKRTNFGRLW